MQNTVLHSKIKRLTQLIPMTASKFLAQLPHVQQAKVSEMSNALSHMLCPKSIVVIGATPDTNKLNGRPLHFLQRDGYKGKLYGVNPKYSEINGTPCFPDIASLPETPDLAVVAVSQKLATAAVGELGKKGVPVAVLFSSGYSEIGPQGAEYEKELLDVAKTNGIRICGPNNLGLINAFEHVTATFSQYADETPIAGPVAFASQSGAFGTGISALARSRGIGLGYFVNTGNQADITLTDALIEIADDRRISVLCGYIEGLRDGDGLIRLAEKARETKKPLIITKVGRKAAGARAAASHTGSLAGEDRVFDGVLRQHGGIRARNEEHMLDLVMALSCCGPTAGKGLALITQSGGAGVLMADRAEELGLDVPMPSPETQEKLREVIPAFGSASNPIDVTGQFLAEPKILSDSIKIALEDPAIDCCIVWLQLMHGYSDLLTDVFKDVKANVDKPFIVCWIEAPEKARKQLLEADICVISATERAVDAAAGLVRYGEIQVMNDAQPSITPTLTDKRMPTENAIPVPAMKAAALLQEAGITLAPAVIATDADSACDASDQLGYPVAVKIESSDILHKTEAGGVKLGLRDRESVKAATDEVLANARAYNPSASIDGVIVQHMAKPTTELVLGIRRDPVFGPVVMVGLGGIFIEILEDVSFAAAPITPKQADQMINVLQGRAVLEGARGKSPVDQSKLAELICKLSDFALAHPELVELDLNPVFADGDNFVAVDWLMMVDGD